jgi:hypothetical protein
MRENEPRRSRRELFALSLRALRCNAPLATFGVGLTSLFPNEKKRCAHENVLLQSARFDIGIHHSAVLQLLEPVGTKSEHATGCGGAHTNPPSARFPPYGGNGDAARILSAEAKSGIINPKSQAPNPSEISIANTQTSTRRFWDLKFDAWSFPGAWGLGFGIFPRLEVIPPPAR